jgi:hypothetical protein
MREYNAETKHAILGHLARAESVRPGPADVELWSLTKGERALACVAV